MTYIVSSGALNSTHSLTAWNTRIQTSELDSGGSRNFEKGGRVATVIYRECT